MSTDKELADRGCSVIGGIGCFYKSESAWCESCKARARIRKQSIKSGVYKHFKGNIYHVLGVAENTETKELTVIYIPQYGEYKGKLCNRSLAMFIEEVDKPEYNYRGPRFALVEERSFIGLQAGG